MILNNTVSKTKIEDRVNNVGVVFINQFVLIVTFHDEQRLLCYA